MEYPANSTVSYDGISSKRELVVYLEVHFVFCIMYDYTWPYNLEKGGSLHRSNKLQAVLTKGQDTLLAHVSISKHHILLYP